MRHCRDCRTELPELHRNFGLCANCFDLRKADMVRVKSGEVTLEAVQAGLRRRQNAAMRLAEQAEAEDTNR